MKKENIKDNFGNILINYIILLIKCNKLHEKLENLYLQLSKKADSFLKKQILKVNNTLNDMLAKVMEYQWIIEYKQTA